MPQSQSLIFAPLMQKCKVQEITGDTLWVDRLMEMGVHVGSEILIRQKLVFGGPFIVQLGSIRLALRAKEAECILVVPI